MKMNEILMADCSSNNNGRVVCELNDMEGRHKEIVVSALQVKGLDVNYYGGRSPSRQILQISNDIDYQNNPKVNCDYSGLIHAEIIYEEYALGSDNTLVLSKADGVACTNYSKRTTERIE
jgi:hypothetical protein